MSLKKVSFMIFALGLFLGTLGLASAFAQSTVATGSIQGTVTDPSGASVPNARVTITNKDTAQVIKLTTSSAGVYTSGPLTPGNYAVRIEAGNFKTADSTVVVEVGVITPGNVQLQVGTSSTVVEVSGASVLVNTEQAAVQGVLNAEQIEELPINGRNFLDLAQLEPGVQIQDGSNFDPTKVGFSSISFGGRFGRTARIEVDGVDVSDETVGTTTENIPAGALQEFQLSQSTLDLSSELTSSGAVNTVTKSGTNDFHGEALYLFRDSRTAAALPGPKAPYQRNHMEGNLAGPIIKDKLFFFGDGLRIKQDLLAPVPLPDPFTSFSGGFNAPFRENDAFGRVDWQATSGLRMFYRFSYFSDLAVSNVGVGFQPYQDKNYTRQHVVGADFTTGSYTHSIRFAYLKFYNNLIDVVRGSNLPLANLPVSITIGPLATGPNFLSPQATPQSNHQIKYDGSRIVSSHIFRYGVDFNRLNGGGFAAFQALAPQVFDGLGSSEEAFAATQTFTCPNGTTGANCPFNYPVELAQLGNGLGFTSEIPSFGFPAGGLGPDHRFGFYVGDSWKVKPNITVTGGVRYVRDTLRTDSDLPAIPALDAILPGFGARVHQPNHNFAPQLGVAWDPWKKSKTVIRSGIGIFFENTIWNNELFDRPLRLPKGAFLANPFACVGSSPTPVIFADGTVQTPPVGACSTATGGQVAIGDGSPGTAAALLAAFQGTSTTPGSYQGVAASVGANAPNASFFPNLISSGTELFIGAIAPGFKTPRSIQMNFGVQHELRPGLVLTADYLRNIGLHNLLGVDVNHSGDVAYFNKNAAMSAINATLAACGVATIDQAIAACPGLHPANPPTMPQPGPATIADFGGKGLDSAADLGVGSCGIALGFDCAFPGITSAVGPAPFLFPIGRSIYNALDLKLRGNLGHFMPGIKHANFQAAYALSRFQNPGGGNAFFTSFNQGFADQDFILPALDNRDPLRYTGDASLDRRHQISFGGFVELPLRIKIGTILHFDSPLAGPILVPSTFGNGTPGAGEIFQTDFTGDGTIGDPLPGTNVGSFQRSVSAGGLNNLLTNYSNKQGGQLTPAGQVLVANNLFTQNQLLELCAYTPALTQPSIVASNPALSASCAAANPNLSLAPPGQVGLFWLKTLDLKLSWSAKVKERFMIEPGVSFYNLFNFANFDTPINTLDSYLTGAPGSINGTTYVDQSAQRIGAGTGTFALGAPRSIEFSLRITF